MISAKDNVTCPDSMRSKLGWNAMYDCCKDFNLQEGVVLVSLLPISRELIAFQLLEDINLLDVRNGVVKAIAGSPVILGTEAITMDNNKFKVEECRFPTKDELERYNSLPTI